MSVSSATVRLTLRLSAAVVLWAMSAAAGYALPAVARHRPAVRHVQAKPCDERTPTMAVRKLVRQTRAIGGGPLTKRLRMAGIRFNPRAGLRHATRAMMRDDEQAIQNDASAAPLAVDLEIELRPIGVFADTQAAPLASRALSPRSPRGPPDPTSHGFRSVAVSSIRGDLCEWFSQT